MLNLLKSIKRVDIFMMTMFAVLSAAMAYRFSTRLGTIFLILTLGGYLIWIFRERVDWFSFRVISPILILFFLLFGWRAGGMVARGHLQQVIVFSALGVGIYTAFFFKRPDIVLVLAMILITNMLSIYDVNRFRVPGFFKMRDLILVFSIAPVLLRDIVSRRDMRDWIESPVAKAILAFTGMISLFALMTFLRYDNYSINLLIRSTREYIYFIFFFGVIASIKTDREIKFMFKIMVILSIIAAILFVMGAFGLALWGPYRGAGVMIGEGRLIRQYISIGFAGFVMCWLLGLFPFLKKRMALFALLAIGTLLLIQFFSFGRAGWYATGLCIVLLTFFMPKERRGRYIAGIMGLVFVFLSFLLFLALVSPMAADKLFSIGADRAASGVRDFAAGTGTFAARIWLFERYSLTILNEHPLIGLGFLSPGTAETRYFPCPQGAITTVDSAIVTILNTTGMIGMLTWVLLYTVFILRTIYISRRINNNFYKGIAIGSIAIYIGPWITSFTAYSLLAHEVHLIMGFALALSEVMYRIDRSGELRWK